MEGDKIMYLGVDIPSENYVNKGTAIYIELYWKYCVEDYEKNLHFYWL